jgi:TatD DNase family protein
MCANSLNLLFRNDAHNLQVGINLGDPIFRGVYHGKRAHDDDLDQVVQRALDVGCTKLMVTGSDLKESAHAIEIAKQFRTQ